MKELKIALGLLLTLGGLLAVWLGTAPAEPAHVQAARVEVAPSLAGRQLSVVNRAWLDSMVEHHNKLAIAADAVDGDFLHARLYREWPMLTTAHIRALNYAAREVAAPVGPLALADLDKQWEWVAAACVNAATSAQSAYAANDGQAAALDYQLTICIGRLIDMSNMLRAAGYE